MPAAAEQLMVVFDEGMKTGESRSWRVDNYFRPAQGMQFGGCWIDYVPETEGAALEKAIREASAFVDAHNPNVRKPEEKGMRVVFNKDPEDTMVIIRSEMQMHNLPEN